jgi:ferredoxin-NADP reductase
MSNVVTSPFRPFAVVGKIRESSTITSFHLKPLDRKDWRPFEAGQFLTIQVPDPSSTGFVLRNYTISSSPSNEGVYRITVKREASPSPGIDDGLGSCWLHDRVDKGSIVNIDGPRGSFKLDKASKRPVILLSGGVGLTPTVSMLKVLAEQHDRPVWFIHACDNGDVHALHREIDALSAGRPSIQVHYCYRFPSADDTQHARFHSAGFISRETIQRLLPLDNYEVYMCGPPPFMQAMYVLLTSLGINKESIAYEFFGPASLLSEEEKRRAADDFGAIGKPVSVQSEDGIHITLNKSDHDFVWDGSSESILSFLEARGIEPAFSCRAGVCGSCIQDLVSGDVEYLEEPLEDVPVGKVLLCCSRPTRSVVLDL